jgi:hypothetical protein
MLVDYDPPKIILDPNKKIFKQEVNETITLEEEEDILYG